jgi:hypothetical protein
MKKGLLFTPSRGLMSGYITPVLTVGLFVFLFGISIFSLIYKSNANTAAMIEKDLHQFVDIFKQIDKDCKILNFDYTLNRINFLNVKSFSGSEVGAINLAFPQHWKGPYVADNPTIQGEEYLIVVTHKGYFVVPGTGVRLPNGKIVGRDVVLNKDADIEAMMKIGGVLNYKGTPLAAKLDVGSTVAERVLREHMITLDEE